MSVNTLLRGLPKVDRLISSIKECVELDNSSYSKLYEIVNEVIAQYRKDILDKKIESFEVLDIQNEVIARLEKKDRYNLKRLINGTGTILHTNLGRAVYSQELISHLEKTLIGYSNLEFNLESGKRGSRYSHIESLIAKVVGTESALVVNNNAAAVLLCLNEFAKGQEVIISRGELVEVGGSFRIPDIMELSGAKLVEVGTTNRTHLEDYTKRITEDTAMLLKVHTSNFFISGFTKSIANKELVALAKEKNLITMEDLGSGVIIDFSKYGLRKEPTILEAVKSGIDLVTFSGDKLLGGPQCGVIVGKKELIDRLKKNQFLRAFRVCKMTLASLEFIFNQYLDEKLVLQKNPTLNRILEAPQEVLKRAEILKSKLEKIGVKSNIIATKAIIGGGSMPDATLDSYGVEIEEISALEIERGFLKLDIPIIGRVQNNRYIIDLKTIWESEYSEIVNSFKELKLNGIKN